MKFNIVSYEENISSLFLFETNEPFESKLGKWTLDGP